MKNSIKKLILLLMTLSSSLPVATTKETRFDEFEIPKTLIEKISIAHLSSLTTQDVEEQAANAKIQSENAKKIAELKITGIKEVFGPIEQLKTAYNLHNTAAYGLDGAQACAITDNTLSDLSLYCGDKESPDYHVSGSIDKTETISGKIALQALLAQPTYNTTKLKKRQAFIKLLMQDEKLYQHITSTLKTIKKHEGVFLSVARDMQAEIEKYYREVLFEISALRDLNKNVTLMHGGVHLLAGKEFYMILTEVLALCVFIESIYIQPIHPLFRPMARQMTLQGLIFPGILFTGLLAYTGYQYSTRLPIVKKLKEKMNGVAQVLIKTHRDLAQTLVAHRQALAILPELEENTLSNLSEKDSKQILKVLQGLESSWFKAGHAAAAFERRDELLKNNFNDSYKFLGLIDAYTSIATLMRENQDNQNGRYCFVDYITKADKPVINLKGFWHPMLNPEKVVTNDINLGSETPSNGIITGPNAGGKSTCLRGVCLSVLFASTLGIAPATQATITPFHNIATYLNVADSEGKESLFQAEMRRAQSLLNSIKALAPNQFSFVAMDELLTGTNPKEAVAGVRGIAERLGSFANSSVLLTTHFVELTLLEKETNDFTNFKVTVDKVNGKFKFPYKLELGITDQAIALELLAESGFDNEILQTAYAYMNR
jgi:DNA mismatch repair ATPase MutS